MMNETDPIRVVILGGGTAGWMAAAALSKYLGGRVSITLIESEAIGTVGVGESTIPQIRLFNSGLGIDEREFIRETSATIKLGIEFSGWQREGHRYFHGFGDVGRKVALLPFYQYWLRYHEDGGTLPLESFSANAEAARQGRYGPRAGGPPARLPGSAYQFDAGRYAALLRRFAEARGVTRREGLVRETHLHNESGFIEALTLDDGTRIAGDLFVDCSGFRSVLLGEALQTGFEEWAHWLPCDRAFAVASEGNGRLDPFTRVTARDAGWQWQIPLQHRTGNGHVYGSAFMPDDVASDALMATLPGAPLAEPRLLRFRTGKRYRTWVKNCVALGLSSGFLEPLESTSIHLVQSGIARLVALFPDRECDPALIAEYNRQIDFEFVAIRDFLILHYHLNEREGLDFWDYCRNMTLPDSLAEKIDLFRASGGIMRFNNEIFDVQSWLQVMWGQGLRPRRHHPMVDAAQAADVAQYINTTAREVAEQVGALADHADYIARIAGAAQADAARSQGAEI